MITKSEQGAATAVNYPGRFGGSFNSYDTICRFALSSNDPSRELFCIASGLKVGFYPLVGFCRSVLDPFFDLPYRYDRKEFGESEIKE